MKYAPRQNRFLPILFFHRGINNNNKKKYYQLLNELVRELLSRMPSRFARNHIRIFDPSRLYTIRVIQINTRIARRMIDAHTFAGYDAFFRQIRRLL